jgi:hypothetical protein
MLRTILILLLAPATLAEEWWSLQPLRRPPAPAAGEGWARTPIDHFIAQIHAERKLQPAPEADRRGIIRRLYFDLIGLPPTPEAVAVFVADTRPDAYERLVDELLASPHYGERWARHWLDVVHYGDTHGYDKDKLRRNAWPYRDYVIKSFNDDTPYSRFIQEQLAGDVLDPKRPDLVAATGFIVAGPWDFIGHVEVPGSKIDGKVARNLDRNDMVVNTIQTFTSTTIQCARCHDHKFDPFSKEDYYSLQAVFAAIGRNDRPFQVDADSARQRTVLLAQQRALPGRTDSPRSNRYGYHSQIAKTADSAKWVQVDLGERVKIDQIRLFASNEWGWSDFGFPVAYKVEASNRADFSRSALLHQTGKAPRPGSAAVVIDGKNSQSRYIRVTATRLWSRRHHGKPPTKDWIFALDEMRVLSNGVNIARGKPVTAKDSIEAGQRWARSNLVDGLTRLTMTPALAAIQKQLDALPKPGSVYAAATHFKAEANHKPSNGKPVPIHVLARGQVTKPGDLVAPRTLEIPGLESAFKLADGHDESARRVALADWLIDRKHPLTWRSIVNRIWGYHFGNGIVSSQNDFGKMGEPPTHPALLDWLAVEFRDGGQSFKKLHKLIVTSAVYRQQSTHSAANATLDSSNQYLWRMHRRRLSAEEIRDSILMVSGKLNREMGGPGFFDFVLEKATHSPHYQYHKHDPNDAKTHRRSIYRFIVRSQPQPFLTTMDCADPSISVPTRSETLTALQALAMFNNPFVIAMSEHFADSARTTSAPEAYLLSHSFSRPPSDRELRRIANFAKANGLESAARALFNSNEFLFVE